MDIDEFLDREISLREIDKKIDIESEGLKLEYPKAKDEIKEYAKENDYLTKIKQALEKNDFNAAEKLYYELWTRLSGNIEWDQDIHDNLIKISNEIKNALNEVYSKANKKGAFAQNLLKKTKENIMQGNYQAALIQHSELTDIYNEIPDFLFEEKRKMHNEILNLYMGLKEKINFVFLNKFNASLSQIKQMMDSASLSLKNMDLDNAKNIYLDIIKVYTDLPAGFLFSKIGIGKDILELYKELSISLEIKFLEGLLSKEKFEIKPFGNKEIERLRKMTNVFDKPAQAEKHIEKPQLFGQAPQMKTKISLHDKEIKRLREMSLQRKGGFKRPRASAMERLSSITKTSKTHPELKNLLIKRRLQRAKLEMDKGFYNEAKKDLESVLRLDTDNTEAKDLLNKTVQR